MFGYWLLTEKVSFCPKIMALSDSGGGGAAAPRPLAHGSYAYARKQ